MTVKCCEPCCAQCAAATPQQQQQPQVRAMSRAPNVRGQRSTRTVVILELLQSGVREPCRETLAFDDAAQVSSSKSPRSHLPDDDTPNVATRPRLPTKCFCKAYLADCASYQRRGQKHSSMRPGGDQPGLAARSAPRIQRPHRQRLGYPRLPLHGCGTPGTLARDPHRHLPRASPS